MGNAPTPGFTKVDLRDILKLVNNVKNFLTTSKAAKGGTELFNFGITPAGHMTNPARKVPIQILDDVIKNTKGLTDPEGSKGLMHYSEMFKNGNRYNLEVLYDKTSNSIWHFKYTRDAVGPLKAIPK